LGDEQASRIPARRRTELLSDLANFSSGAGSGAIVIFEGRDAAGKGGVIKPLTERVSLRVFRVVALAAPSERQRTQMYFQRYVERFPAVGEIVIFDRIWCNRAGVERVMGYCSDQEMSAPQDFPCLREGDY
jgi:polyphosphate kinase